MNIHKSILKNGKRRTPIGKITQQMFSYDLITKGDLKV